MEHFFVKKCGNLYKIFIIKWYCLNCCKVSLLETSLAIETVSTTAQESAESSEGILSSVDETTIAIQEVAKSAQRQAELSEELNSLIQKFKI